MTSKKFQSEILRRVEELLNNLPKERLRKIVERRFGLKDGNRETLDAVGRDYNITRERVRQIEADALRILNEGRNIAILTPIFEHVDKLFEEHNHLIGEERLLNLSTNISGSHPARAAVMMVLTLGKPYFRIPEDERFYPHWITKKKVKERAEKVVGYLVRHFNQQNQTFPLAEVLTIISSEYQDLPEKFIQNVVDISKEIDKNIFGEMGLSHWPAINPRGVRDRAYLVMKREGAPRHFVDITDLINKANLSNRQAFPQTVHNELIKDDRFILVGRGIYALSEWGYEAGIVKEVIIKILLRADKPLARNEIVSAVLKQRQVKPNTVVINLQNNPAFERLEDGRYRLK